MPHTDFALSSAMLIDRPCCPQCGAPMWLVRMVPIEPHSNQRTLQLNQRTFKCPACEIAKDVPVKSD